MFQSDSEVHISLSDQQKINRFARLNNRLEDLKDETKARKNEMQTLEDAGTDLMMLEDDEEKVRREKEVEEIEVEVENGTDSDAEWEQNVVLMGPHEDHGMSIARFFEPCCYCCYLLFPRCRRRTGVNSS